MLYIVGVNHGIQYPIGSNRSDFSDDEIKCFLFFIKQQISIIGSISFIAEEMSCDAMNSRFINSTCLLDFTKQSNHYKHIFVDPEILEQEKLGIKTSKDIEPQNIKQESSGLRERFWLNRLEANSTEDGIVVIGSSHIKSFSELLKSEMIEYYIISSDWKPDATCLKLTY